MHTVILGSFTISFKSPLISVPSDGTEHDWICEGWIDVPQQVEVTSHGCSATVLAHTGYGAAIGPHTIETLAPTIGTDQGLLEYILQSATVAHKISRDAVLLAVSTANYPWGTLFSMDWTRLGDAPGGIQHWMLLPRRGVVSVGFLQLDWGTVQVHAND
jgi:hypothetical protein